MQAQYYMRYLVTVELSAVGAIKPSN